MTITIMGRQITLKKWQIAAAAAIVVLALGAVGMAIGKGGGQVIIEGKKVAAETGRETGTVIEGGEEVKEEVGKLEEEVFKDEIKVYVTGAVKTPGIVTLAKGQLIYDAVRAAGGFTSDADTENINLVYSLTENVTLKINAKNAPKPAPKVSAAAQPAQAGSEAGMGAELIRESGVTMVGVAAEAEKSSSAAGFVNINAATAAELDTLPGIGPSYAEDIINYRTKNGPYKSIQDIMKVPGIKQSKFDKIKDRISVN